MSSFLPSIAAAYGVKSSHAAVVSGTLLYLLLVRALRYRRANSWKKKYGFSTRESLAKMTLEQAHEINKQLSSQEFPATFVAALFFALFKTYGIPSISRLLVATNQLSSEKNVSKRAADTTAIVVEVIVSEPTSDRHIDSIARVNYLHSKYRKAGKITDNDMLYTLSLFALEPARWTARLEWRQLNDVEKCALGLFWRDVGTSMEIPYGSLEPYMREPYDDGLAWLKAIDAWSVDYEAKYMSPAPSNEQVAKSTLYLALYNVPFFLKGFSLRLTGCLLEPRLRKAVMIPEPELVHKAIVHTFVGVRKVLLRHLSLPRPFWLRRREISDVDPKTGRIHLMQYVAHPWYVKPTWTARWSLDAWIKKFTGGVVPGDGGTKYQPNGYLIHELGPDYQKGKGAEEMAKDKERLLELRKSSGCPMTGMMSAKQL